MQESKGTAVLFGSKADLFSSKADLFSSKADLFSHGCRRKTGGMYQLWHNSVTVARAGIALLHNFVFLLCIYVAQ